MNVLHLSSNIKFGGSEQQLIYLTEATNKQNISNFIFCFDSSILLEYKDVIVGQLIAVPKQKTYSLKLLKVLRDTVKNNSIDIIHIHNGKFVLTYMLCDMLFKLNTKCVFSKKDMSTSSSVFSKLKYNYSGINKITCVTEAIKNRFQKLLYKKNHHKLMVLRDGLNPNALAQKASDTIHSDFNIQPNKLILGNVANHVTAKDLFTFINTIDYLINTLKINNVHVLQIGRFTHLTPKLKELVKEKHLESYITFTDFIKDGFKYTSQFDIFLMSSQSEGLPLSILESFYYKIPVVSTKAGGIPEAIIHENNGLLANVKDHKNLANQLLKLVKNKSLRNHITENAYKYLEENFTSNVMANKTISLYKSIV
jgi:glycosyltransferase involved in cell wall biosynthesis